MKLLSVLIDLLVIGLSCDVFGQSEPRPNIIYVLSDDLGYGDLGCYGSQLQRTPHIDALAAGGVRLTDFHAAPWCAPSRRALMTGCHASRPWATEAHRWGRLAAAMTLPETLKTAGYSTALLGKWHLEMEPGLHPLDQGFDYWYGTRGSNDWDGPRPNYGAFLEAPESAWRTPLYVNRENRGPIVPQSEFTRRYTEEAIRLIEEKDERPLFLYVAHNMPHVPIFASADFQGKSRNGVYGDVIEELDASVGSIVTALKRRGLWENTVMVFTSDNGPWSMFNEFGGAAHPLRGEKSTTWEGGERVPCVISWPGRIRPSVYSGLMVNYDMYATLASWAGVAIPRGHAMDSLDLSTVLMRGGPSPRSKHLYYFREPTAYRRGPYKLHVMTRERTRDPITGKQEASVVHDPPLLFDLNRDLGERTNIAAKHPELVRELLAEFRLGQVALEQWKPFQ